VDRDPEREAWAAATAGLAGNGPAEVVAALARARAERAGANDVAAEAALREAVAAAPEGPFAIAARVALGWHLHLTGHPDEADAELDAAIGLAIVTDRPFLLARARHLRGVVLFHRGRIDEAGVEFRAAVDLDRAAGRAIANTLSGLADVLAERGDVVGARRTYGEALALARADSDDVFARTIEVRLAGAVAFDDLDAAWEMAVAAHSGFPAQSYWAPLAPAIAGAIALLRGDRDAAATLASQAVAALGRAVPDLVAAEAMLLRALATTDRSDPTADRSVTEALGLWRRIGNPVWLARAEACLAARDRSPRGRAALDRARQRLRRLGVSRLAFGPAGGPLLALLPTTEPVEVRCLGGFAVVHEGVPVPPTAWQSRKARELLKLLAAARGRPIPREELMERLWPDEEPGPQANRLSVALATLRAVLDPDRARPATHYISSDGASYALDLANLPIDTERFLAQAAAARSAAGDDRRDALEAAEAAYSGDAFEDDPYADWAVSLREECRAAYAETARALARLAIERADTDGAVRYALRLLERDAYDEDAHHVLIRSLAGAHRHGEARRAHAIYAARMRELDVVAPPLEELA
jgi:DNA-binding SARP family transcriptional activator